ncbi:MAG: O-antigen ligase family protein [Lachnospiraceae bacterium]|nr:O-antigen ligase family protein [Lachnospiraceae bacterium]
MGKRSKPALSRRNRLMELNILAYLSAMLGVFPLFFLHQYEKIGTLKYTLFFYSSTIFLGITILLVTLKIIAVLTGRMSHPNIVTAGGRSFYALKLSFADKVMLFYGACVLLSFLFSDFKEFALKGADGWQMGLCAQLIFLGLYFVLSRYRTCTKVVMVTHFISSGLVFLLGILHRFDVDPVGMYPGLTVLQKKEFLSTLGQATWYSSYVCTVFSLGIMVFYFAKKAYIRLGAAVYAVLAFGTLVTQNSDSAFVAIAGVLLILGYFSLGSPERLVRFWQLMALIWGTFGSMGLLQRIFVERMIPLDSLSLFFSQSICTWICFAVSVLICLLLERSSADKLETLLPFLKILYRIMLVILALSLLGLVIFIYLNTKGYLLQRFGYQSANTYLYFNHQWGNNRGSSWMLAWQQFKELPLIHKLFGVGPDSFSAHLYSMEETREYLRALWGNLTLTNAHNEYLNHLICYGVAGLLAWLGVLVGGILYFYKKAADKPWLIGFVLCIAAYGCHNFFCYQQVCCTPFLFIFMGLGEGLTKWGKSPTIIRNGKNKGKSKV